MLSCQDVRDLQKVYSPTVCLPTPNHPNKTQWSAIFILYFPGKMMRNEVNWLSQFWSLSYLSNRGHFGHFSRLPRMPKMQLIGVGSQHLEAKGPAGSLWIGYWLVVWNMFFIGYRPTTMGIWWLYWFVVWNRIFFPYIGNNHPNWLNWVILFRGVVLPPTRSFLRENPYRKTLRKPPDLMFFEWSNFSFPME